MTDLVADELYLKAKAFLDVAYKPAANPDRRRRSTLNAGGSAAVSALGQIGFSLGSATGGGGAGGSSGGNSSSINIVSEM